jgi:hypothetical protein
MDANRHIRTVRIVLSITLRTTTFPLTLKKLYEAIYTTV